MKIKLTAANDSNDCNRDVNYSKLTFSSRHQLSFRTPSTLPTLSLLPSFPGMSAPPLFAALPHLSGHAASSQLLQKQANSSKAKQDSTFKRLQMLGMNKPRSNSIPNFQTSNRFARLFNPSLNVKDEDSKGQDEADSTDGQLFDDTLPSYLTALNRPNQ